MDLPCVSTCDVVQSVTKPASGRTFGTNLQAWFVLPQVLTEKAPLINVCAAVYDALIIMSFKVVSGAGLSSSAA